MGKPSGQGLTRSHVKRLVKLMVVGVCIFLLALAGLQAALSFGGLPPDRSFYNFYPIMAVLGAVFGFERWWGQEQGDYNPFHDG